MVVMSMVLLSSCSIVADVLAPSPARKCRKAEGYFAKGIRICPEAANLKLDTLHLTLPGASSKGSSLMRNADADSVAAACEQLREALEAERQLAEITNGVASRIVRRQQLSLDSMRTALAKRAAHSSLPTGEGRGGAISKLRNQLCPFEAIHDSTALHDLRISWSPSGVLYTIEDFPREADIPTAHQTITAGPVNVQEGINGWLVAGCILGGIGWLVALVLFLMFKSERNLRLNPPSAMKTLLLCLLLLPLATNGQDIPVITEWSESRNGSRSLHIHGTFIDADTVYVQLYTPGETLADTVFFDTWDLTLSAYDEYTIRFTDEKQREKVLRIQELSDHLHESIALLTIDFRRRSNLTLRKSTDGMPDFMMEETGLGRQR